MGLGANKERDSMAKETISNTARWCIAIVFVAGGVLFAVRQNTTRSVENGKQLVQVQIDAARQEAKIDAILEKTNWINNYLMEWEPQDATRRKTQSKAKAEEKSNSQGQAQG